jgi:hypothetical protein
MFSVRARKVRNGKPPPDIVSFRAEKSALAKAKRRDRLASRLSFGLNLVMMVLWLVVALSREGLHL